VIILVCTHLGCRSISREELGIVEGVPSQTTCHARELKIYDNDKYNREVGANDYLLYAIAALNAYEGGSKYGFVLTKFATDWKKMNPLPTKVGGLAYDYYFRESPDRLDVLVAFRGTEMYDLMDWWANLSWLTKLLSFRDEYDSAREEFTKVRQHAFSLAKNRTVYFAVTGHSLGGALAQHVALAFPCTSAVVFNTSFVTNKNRLKQPFDNVQVVHIYENNEVLTWLLRKFSKDEETISYHHYNMELTPASGFQHSMENLAVGMARMVVDCQKQANCAISPKDPFAFNTYCDSYGKVGPDELCTK
jgi:dienelactone hydrolase